MARELDFLYVHLHPESGKMDESLDILRGFSVGKPVVVEEIFPLKCNIAELPDFIQRSTPTARGWVGFYWGKTPAEMRSSKTNADALTLAWLDFFREHAHTETAKGAAP